VNYNDGPGGWLHMGGPPAFFVVVLLVDYSGRWPLLSRTLAYRRAGLRPAILDIPLLERQNPRGKRNWVPQCFSKYVSPAFLGGCFRQVVVDVCGSGVSGVFLPFGLGGVVAGWAAGGWEYFRDSS
jgi:hypothetical protein